MRPQRQPPASSGPGDEMPPWNWTLPDKLASIRARTGVTAISMTVLQNGEVTAQAESGVRREGKPDPVRATDVWHLASCGKSMTATLIARLVERDTLSWRTSIGEHFPDAHPTLAGITIRQLLCHTVGLQRDPPWTACLRRSTGDQTRARRDAIAAKLVRKKPKTPPGESFMYSNAGYIVAAVMAERAAGESFESLMKSEVFDPLGMHSAAYGSPASPPPDGQACGHLLFLGQRWPVTPSAYANRSQHYAPASTVFMSMADWTRFAQVHLDCGETDVDGGGFLRPETFKILHTPVQNGYALGWFKQGGLLEHPGGNPMWAAKTWLYPEKNAAILVAFNQAWDKAAGSAVTILYGEVFPRYIPGETYMID